ncbi:Gfo/Idh/MocA family protein [Pediococcus cellicola]|uniref:Putative oxidoreductase (Putative) n=1 Tax=Pediococcus cellicola TaxID=319652 RepID=A0A0R2IPM2_9LACO|nr:Gfo/Idh/MocA family oxidoreductase [Pediococcus cellicola]KRN66670.1 putative oxidoreductase (putative) [Pediococcus cellicola]GEL14686.1 oxidoreductase [Pediococcus cellicola]
MKKIGVMGLGNIAQKAYLPVMTKLQDTYEWHFCTRNAVKRTHLQHQYGITHGEADLEELLDQQPKAVFVHTPTETHYAIIKTLLQHGIHVYVDKPVSENFAEVEELYRLAASKHLILTCGFNRRFVPFNQRLKALPDKQMIQSAKIRVQDPQEAKFAIYDLLIHVVDTICYLLDEPVQKQTTKLFTDGSDLRQAIVALETAHSLATAEINLIGGVNQETTTVQTEHGLATVENCQTYNMKTPEGEQKMLSSDWQSTLVTRGFEPLINQFLAAIDGKQANPVSPESSLLSHRICQDAVSHLEVVK